MRPFLTIVFVVAMSPAIGYWAFADESPAAGMFRPRVRSGSDRNFGPFVPENISNFVLGGLKISESDYDSIVSSIAGISCYSHNKLFTHSAAVLLNVGEELPRILTTAHTFLDPITDESRLSKGDECFATALDGSFQSVKLDLDSARLGWKAGAIRPDSIGDVAEVSVALAPINSKKKVDELRHHTGVKPASKVVQTGEYILAVSQFSGEQNYAETGFINSGIKFDSSQPFGQIGKVSSEGVGDEGGVIHSPGIASGEFYSFDIQTVGGQSGSPVLAWDGEPPDRYFAVAGLISRTGSVGERSYERFPELNERSLRDTLKYSLTYKPQ